MKIHSVIYYVILPNASGSSTYLIKLRSSYKSKYEPRLSIELFLGTACHYKDMVLWFIALALLK